jgi:hypothetical protein
VERLEVPEKNNQQKPEVQTDASAKPDAKGESIAGQVGRSSQKVGPAAAAVETITPTHDETSPG